MAKKSAKKAAADVAPLTTEDQAETLIASSEMSQADVTLSPPPSDPAMGDKTPEVMEWYRLHQPEEYVRRYENRVTPHSAGVRQVTRREDGPPTDFEDEDGKPRKPKVLIP